MEKILLIDDDTDILNNLSEFLEMEGYKVLSANGGKVGIDLAKKFVPDLIICDVMMPGMNGFQVLRSLLQNRTTCEIPFVFSSALSDGAVLSEAEMNGADDYITKPYQLESVLELARNQIKSGSKRHH